MERIRHTDTDAETTASAAASAAAAASAVAAKPKASLPDLEQINSTLRAGTDKQPLEASGDTLNAGSSGFARGFFSMLLLMAVLIGLYVLAPSIKDAVPGLGGVADAYVTQVDMLRVWLADVVQNLLTWLDGMSSEAAGK
jgi:hypothetical protein